MMHDSLGQTDRTGAETLSIFQETDRFNEWMYQTIHPYMKGDVLEVGSGIGNISLFPLRDGFRLTLTDYNPHYVEHLKKHLGAHPSVSGITQMDLNDPLFEEKHAALTGQFDTVFLLNVLEHIPDDTKALHNCRSLLRPGGHLIVLVPSYRWLYAPLDKELGHFRRYTTRSLSEQFKKNDLEILHKQYFNFAGIWGWLINGRLLHKKLLPEGQVKIYERLVPLFKLTDKIILNTMGLSTIVIGKKSIQPS
jgi:2-polyprenyl-3-methyl-5-hydroxy-6-metoxy-1,4-benzoquinol methylase